MLGCWSLHARGDCPSVLPFTVLGSLFPLCLVTVHLRVQLGTPCCCGRGLVVVHLAKCTCHQISGSRDQAFRSTQYLDLELICALWLDLEFLVPAVGTVCPGPRGLAGVVGPKRTVLASVSQAGRLSFSGEPLPPWECGEVLSMSVLSSRWVGVPDAQVCYGRPCFSSSSGHCSASSGEEEEEGGQGRACA